ncbi:MAG: CDP-diacylglycerol--glycerol-3-phosphate 3-phosphatidyltransferase [Bacilli bacterium]|nr:CDP-diacylglycerol--glycerol-3-phosphate 3-phosphatidyltransferase [Bacilli bacterium]MDD4624027.1 CDP-diacylglycerol--glycerol-3-phosphate 3-phosphatidyltransferase [Bacilli bacterium]
MKMNLPNKLSISRLIMAFLIALVLLFPFYLVDINIPKILVNNILVVDIRYIIAGVLFIIASFTDLLDGRIARKRNLVTNFGKFIDAIADKVLVNTSLIILSAQGFISPAIPVIIIARDTIVDSIRMIASSNGTVIPAGKAGKIKTVVMMIGLSLTFFYNLPFELWNVDVSNVLLIIAVVLSIYSGIEYYYLNKDKLV